MRPGRQSRRWNRFSALMAPNFTANEGRDEAFGVSLRLRGAALRLPHGPFRINCSLNDSDREIDFVCPLRLLILLFAGFRNAAAAPPGGDRETVEVTPRQGASFTLKRLTSKAPPARSAPLFIFFTFFGKHCVCGSSAPYRRANEAQENFKSASDLTGPRKHSQPLFSVSFHQR